MALWWPKDSEFPKGRMDEFRPDEDGRLFQQGDDGAVFVVLEDIVHMMLWRDNFSGLITDICEQVGITFFPGQRAWTSLPAITDSSCAASNILCGQGL